MIRYFLTLLLLITTGTLTRAQQGSFLVLGDLHYDRLVDHDLNWLSTKPDDLRQVTKEYTVYTQSNWSDFTRILQQKSHTIHPPLQAVIQLGDLSEGLAGTEEKARQMASHVMEAVEEIGIRAPWIQVKGNHDITGPGAGQAFQEFYLPMIRRQTNHREINRASYSYTTGDAMITVLDPWDKTIDMVEFLNHELSTSKAKFKFVAIHEPVIPVTERCWHVLRQNPVQREKLLETIARNKAIVLCAHLHRYSVVCRNTPFGPIVQVMVNSVVKERAYQIPSREFTEYGASLAESFPDWQPETLENRKGMLTDEAKYINFYKQSDLPGYAVIHTDSKKETVQLEYFAAFGKEPYDGINLTNLLNP